VRLKVSGIEYIEAIAVAHAKMAAFLTNYDVILSTTLAGPPLPSVIAIPGGLPVKVGEDVIGGVGVSGSPGVDELESAV
jgi:uncharacterized protein GlcG (DUF336 family)